MHFLAIRIFIKRIIAIKSLMKDPVVPKRKKLLVILGLIYLVLPVDIIPVILFPIAWMDDLVVWIFIVLHLKDYLDKYWLGDKTVDIKKNYDGKDIIDNVEFDVEDDQEMKDNRDDDKNE